VKLSDRIHLVGSGALGFQLSNTYDCNVYLLDTGDDCVLIDAGAGLDVPRILDLVRADGLDPTKISHLLLTHAHGDHAGGAAALRNHIGSLIVAASASAAAIIQNGDERGASIDVAKHAGIYPADYRLQPCPIDLQLAADQRLAVGDLEISVIDTPGHCDGHLSFLARCERRLVLFAGDAIFAGGRIQLQPIHDCRIHATTTTLRTLRSLRPDELYPGHSVPVLESAWAHIEQANQALDRLQLPAQMAP